jgi:hypothetical protein
MADSGRVSRAFSLSKLRTMLLRTLFAAVKEDRAAGDRTTRQMRATYERQEAELVRSLDHTRRVLVLLRHEPMTRGGRVKSCQLKLRASHLPSGNSLAPPVPSGEPSIRLFQCAALVPRRQKLSASA